MQSKEVNLAPTMICLRLESTRSRSYSSTASFLYTKVSTLLSSSATATCAQFQCISTP